MSRKSVVKWLLTFLKHKMTRSKLAKVYPISIWQPLIKNHNIKLLDLPKLVSTVIRISENSRGRLLLWKLWRFQYVKIPISIWLHWKVRCSAICWCFDSSILMNIHQMRALQSWEKGFCQSCQINFWTSNFVDLPWNQFCR